MGNGGDVLNHSHLKAHSLQRADRGLTSLAGTLHEDFNRLQAVLHRGAGSHLSGGLCGDMMAERTVSLTNIVDTFLPFTCTVL